MAYKDFETTETYSDLSSNGHIIQAGDSPINLPDNSYIRDANITRDGMDLTLDSPHGTITIEGYFAAETAPDLVAPDGQTLTPQLVNSFSTSPQVYAANSTMTDESPVGGVSEITGEATVTRLDGSVEPISKGTPIFQGDIIETAANGAVNIIFSDETSFAVSEDARLAIDEYVYDPSTNEGTQDFSVLKGVFVFTSGLIGREDPDDVNIDTPSGSIGIRGTIIAGDVNAGEITVVEGAIVVRDFAGNEMTLDNQFETAKFNAGGGVENMGQMAANDVATKFAGVSSVAPTLFSSINDSAAENQAPDAQNGEAPANDASGSVDNNADGNVDGTVDGAAEGAAPTGDAPAGDAPAGDAPTAEPAAADATTQPQAKAPAMPAADPAMGMTGNDMGLSGSDAVSSGAKPAGMGNVGNKAMNTVQAGGAEATAPPAGAGQPPAGAGQPPAGAQTLAPPPPQPQPLQDPTNIAGATPPPVVTPFAGPVHLGSSEATIASFLDYNVGNALGQVNIAPNALGDANFFAAGQGQSWSYDFDHEFVSFNEVNNGISTLTFELSADTLTTLNALQTDGALTYNFNPSGQLDLNWTTSVTAQNFAIEVRAYDTVTEQYSQNNNDGFFTYNYEVFTGTNIGTINGSDVTSVGDDTANTVTLGDTAVTSNNTIQTGAGTDTIILGETGGAYTFAVTDNDINAGDGNDNITISRYAENNNIISGDGNDTFTIHHARNKLWGMDGDDKFILELSEAPGNMHDILTGSDTGMLIDGGTNNFGITFTRTEAFGGNPASSTGVIGDTAHAGIGDMLHLKGNATLDFAAIDDNYIRGIEIINMRDGFKNITMSYSDIIEITDHNNTLIFIGGNDTINLTGDEFSAVDFVKTEDDIVLGGAEFGSDKYDVWTNGEVTLIVEDTANLNANGTAMA